MCLFSLFGSLLLGVGGWVFRFGVWICCCLAFVCVGMIVLVSCVICGLALVLVYYSVVLVFCFDVVAWIVGVSGLGF